MNREHCAFYGSGLTQLRSRSTHANITPIFFPFLSCGFFSSAHTVLYRTANLSVSMLLLYLQYYQRT